VLENAPCCGALAFHISTDMELKEHIQFVNNWFKENDVTNLVTICAGCYNYLVKNYVEYLGKDFNVKVNHLLQFLSNSENLRKLNLKYSGEKLRVNYHDACHLRNTSIPIVEEPRQILNSIENIELIESDFNKTKSICCGAGGGVYSVFKEVSDYSSKLIFKYMKKGKALLTACPFCYTALNRIKLENKIKKPVIKFEDFIIKIMEGVDPISE